MNPSKYSVREKASIYEALISENEAIEATYKVSKSTILPEAALEKAAKAVAAARYALDNVKNAEADVIVLVRVNAAFAAAEKSEQAAFAAAKKVITASYSSSNI